MTRDNFMSSIIILPIVFRKINTISIAALFTISMIFSSLASVHAAPIPPGTTGVKWHPGHYYTIQNWANDDPIYMAQVYKELEATSALRGMQLRYLWGWLEKSPGVYDFSSIDKHLAKLTAMNKRLVIQVQTKSFEANWKLIPDYLKTAEYEGGAFAFRDWGSSTIDGYNIKLWNTNVRNRLTALLKAMGERYNSHPNFEGIGMIETAMGQAVTPLTKVQTDGWFNNLIVVQQNMRTFFPNTMTIQEINYPREYLKQITSAMVKMGGALGCPDIYPDEPGLNFVGNAYSPQGAYPYFAQLSGIVPIAPTVEKVNYLNTRGDKQGHVPTVQEILIFARNELKPNYIFWQRLPEYVDQVLAVMSWKRQTSTPSGGLISTCPSAYSSCITD
ncbi:MAG: glycoside hydrolase [Nitrosomonas sp.]|uniref:glycoside hydrolase n=1 Tax=Nitrosomonas sp. TaxID=42353 RepID=UPI0025D164A3|nr:glycoside hydrolase [Nitrosomonas sp.]MBY0475833.1 glycoside hydrolase [Nitrosomonas sp.]